MRNVNEYHHYDGTIIAVITITVELSYSKEAKLAAQRWADVDKPCLATTDYCDGWMH